MYPQDNNLNIDNQQFTRSKQPPKNTKKGYSHRGTHTQIEALKKVKDLTQREAVLRVIQDSTEPLDRWSIRQRYRELTGKLLREGSACARIAELAGNDEKNMPKLIEAKYSATTTEPGLNSLVDYYGIVSSMITQKSLFSAPSQSTYSR